MLLTIDGLSRQVMPIKEFRAAHDLPSDFSIALFESKDWTGLGRIDQAGGALNSVRATLLNAIPREMAARGWLAFVPGFVRLFEGQLYSINAQVGLKDVEIEFAVAGLSDVCQAVAYHLVGGRFTPPPSPLPVNEEGELSDLKSDNPYSTEYSMRRNIKTPVPWQTPRELYDALKSLARQKRREPTPAENHLWMRLRKKEVDGYKFRRQHTIDRFIVDFYCHEARLVIEVDGSIHGYTPQEDALRQAFLESRGLRVVRFTNDEVFHHIGGVVERIAMALQGSKVPQKHDLDAEEHSAFSPSLPAGRGSGGGVNTFHEIYTDWLNSTVKTFSQVYPYTHSTKTWQVQIFAHAYGRAGMIVRDGESTYYVYDPMLACPAEGFMATLLAEIGTRMIAATV